MYIFQRLFAQLELLSRAGSQTMSVNFTQLNKVFIIVLSNLVFEEPLAKINTDTLLYQTV